MDKTTFPNVEAVVIPAAVLFQFGLTATEKLLYGLVLAASHGGKKRLEFQMSVLALITGISARTIGRSFQNLAAAGLVTVDGIREGRNGGISVRIGGKVAAAITAALLAISAPQIAAAKTSESAPERFLQVNNSMDYATLRRRKRSKRPGITPEPNAKPPANVLPLTRPSEPIRLNRYGSRIIAGLNV